MLKHRLKETPLNTDKNKDPFLVSDFSNQFIDSSISKSKNPTCLTLNTEESFQTKRIAAA